MPFATSWIRNCIHDYAAHSLEGYTSEVEVRCGESSTDGEIAARKSVELERQCCLNATRHMSSLGE